MRNAKTLVCEILGWERTTTTRTRRGRGEDFVETEDVETLEGRIIFIYVTFIFEFTVSLRTGLFGIRVSTPHVAPLQIPIVLSSPSRDP